MTTSTSPTIAWTRLLGTSDNDRADALATGTDGAIDMAGRTDGSLDGQTNSGAGDAFLSKYEIPQVPSFQFSMASGSANEGNSGSTTVPFKPRRVLHPLKR